VTTFVWLARAIVIIMLRYQGKKVIKGDAGKYFSG